MTETELAAELEYLMRRGGSGGPAFPTICAVGANASRPHARPGGRSLRGNDILLVDFGATFGGYRCDLTRMLTAGRIRPEFRRAYESVLSAQMAAIAAVRPGVSAAQVDAAARDTLVREGYGEAFGHGTGHGLGLETHEAPAVSPRAGQVELRPGMVITIEPGVYLPGRFGIRIEDDVLVTGDGCRVLSRLSKDLPGTMLGA
jgi:Xaa-Pro aminopeptidase